MIEVVQEDPQVSGLSAGLLSALWVKSFLLRRTHTPGKLAAEIPGRTCVLYDWYRHKLRPSLNPYPRLGIVCVR